ncbi:uncharacterized protein LOC108113332 [Drosophila eugracilis]|uniref:uncharacterized protein LOC108113332 n=1 Tax=Drosophila eugracilis TaxID=29029 RepID=UPI0007E83A30|nr:uncharacterized protein LOC108113332 [Drosophila eugracilis]
MCIHCCRLRRTPCPPIPYSCPHCPVRTISSCCPLGTRPFTESPFVRARNRMPPSDPCDTLPPRWLEVNRRVIYALASNLGRSPEAAHYILLRLLYANYGKVMMISRKRRSFDVPFSGFPDQDLFSSSTLFDCNGYLSDPMAPETLEKLLHMMQNYIFRLRALNHKYKWFGNGEDMGEIQHLLGKQDELVRLLRNLFGNSDVVCIPNLLTVLSELNINNLFGKWKKKKAPLIVRSISDLYSEVTEPKKPILILSTDRKKMPKADSVTPVPISIYKTPESRDWKYQSLSKNPVPIATAEADPKKSNRTFSAINIVRPIPVNSIALTDFPTIKTTFIPTTQTDSIPTTNAKSNPMNTDSISTFKANSLVASNISTFRSTANSKRPKDPNLQFKVPPEFYEPVDLKKDSNWPSHQQLMSDDWIANDRKELRGLGSLQKMLSVRSEKSFGDAAFGDVFGNTSRISRMSSTVTTNTVPAQRSKS